MKYIITGWVWLCCAVIAQAQMITVRDQQTTLPIPGVVLITTQPGVAVTTNANGQADIAVLNQVTSITFIKAGYRTAHSNWTALESAGFAITLAPSGLDMEEVQVSATRWQQSSGSVPSHVISITSAEMVLQQPQTAADLLGISGKVFIQKSQQGGGSPMIRGFATNRLIYSVDGVRMNTAIFRSGNIQNVINLDPFATEKTEVVFGPASVMYGSDAIGGVMSFQTLTPQLSRSGKMETSGKAVTRYSSANAEQTAHADVMISGKRWAAVTSFSNWNFDHLRQGSNGPDDYIKSIYIQRQDSTDRVITQDDPLLQIPSAYSQFNLMQKLRFKPTNALDIQYGFHYSLTSPYGRYDRNNRVKSGTLRYAEWNYGPQLWMMHQLSITHTHHTPVFDQFTLRLARQNFEESRIDRSLNNKNRNTQSEAVVASSLNLDFVKNTGTRNILYYGVEYVSDEVTSTGRLTDISTGTHSTGASRYPQSDWSSWSLYLNDQLRLSDQVLLQSGLRYSNYLLNADFNSNLAFYPFPFTTATIDNNAITGSLGMVYHPSENWTLRANIGTAFRSPNVDDLGKVFDSAPGAVTVPNPSLKAEYAYNGDLGIAGRLGDVVKIEVNGFYTLLNQALVRRNFTLNGADSMMYDGQMSVIQAIQNAAQAKVYGVQAGVECNLSHGFKLMSDINYQQGEEQLDDGTTSTLRHAAPMFGVSRLRYVREGFMIECNTQYQAERRYVDLPQEEQAKTEIYAKDATGKNYAPAWYTLNVKTTFQLNDHLQVSAGVENITDQRYRPYSSGISGAGRNMVMSLMARF